jgi:hypothetical protein
MRSGWSSANVPEANKLVRREQYRDGWQSLID